MAGGKKTSEDERYIEELEDAVSDALDALRGGRISEAVEALQDVEPEDEGEEEDEDAR